VLGLKQNQPSLYEDVSLYAEEAEEEELETCQTAEQNAGRIEKRICRKIKDISSAVASTIGRYFSGQSCDLWSMRLRCSLSSRIYFTVHRKFTTRYRHSIDFKKIDGIIGAYKEVIF